MSDYSDLLSELSNRIRIKILFMLKEGIYSLTEIAEHIGDISKAEVSRHLSRLLERGLIQKEQPSGRKYEINSFGDTVISIFSPIDFLFRYSEYFKKHRISDLPRSLIREIDALKNCKLIKGAGDVMHRVKAFNSSLAQEKWVMISTAFPFETADVKKAHYIINSDILEQKDDRKKNHPNTQYRIRVLDTIPIAIAFNSLGEGIISFPHIREDKPDYSETLVITDKKALTFLKKTWNYFWHQAEVYS